MRWITGWKPCMARERGSEGGEEGEGGEGGEELIFMHLRVDSGTLRVQFISPATFRGDFSGSVVSLARLRVPWMFRNVSFKSRRVMWARLVCLERCVGHLCQELCRIGRTCGTASKSTRRLQLPCGTSPGSAAASGSTWWSASRTPTWPWTLASLMLQKKQAEADWRQTRDGTEPVSWTAETTAVEAQQKLQPQAHSRCESQKHRT